MSTKELSAQPVYTGKELHILEKTSQMVEFIPVVGGVVFSPLSIIFESLFNDLPSRFLRYFANRNISYLTNIKGRTPAQDKALAEAKKTVAYYNNCISRSNKLRLESFSRIPLLATSYKAYLLHKHVEEMNNRFSNFEDRLKAAEGKVLDNAIKIADLFVQTFDKAKEALITHFEEDKKKLAEGVKFIEEKCYDINHTITTEFDRAKASFLEEVKKGNGALHDKLASANETVLNLEATIQLKYEEMKQAAKEEIVKDFNQTKEDILRRLDELNELSSSFEKKVFEKLDPKIAELNEFIKHPEKAFDLKKIEELKAEFLKKLEAMQENVFDQEEKAILDIQDAVKNLKDNVKSNLTTLDNLMNKVENTEFIKLLEEHKNHLVKKFEEFEKAIEKKWAVSMIGKVITKKKEIPQQPK